MSRLWPAIAAASCAESDYSKLCVGGDQRLAQLIRAAGLVLAAVEQNGDALVQHAIACVENRIAGLLASDELPEMARRAAVGSALRSLQGPRHQTNRSSSSRKRVSAEYRSLLDALVEWRRSTAGTSDVACQFLSTADCAAIDEFTQRKSTPFLDT
jgi:hypothetical protein